MSGTVSLILGAAGNLAMAGAFFAALAAIDLGFFAPSLKAH